MIQIAGASDIRRIKQGEALDELTPAEKARQEAQDWYARVVGQTLVKTYPGVQWKVTIRMGKSGGVAYIQVPRISSQFGMIIHLSDTVFELEHEARQGGGELLERFGISREAWAAERDFSKLKRDIRGEAIGAAKGEQT
jgi:hypothetical protein